MLCSFYIRSKCYFVCLNLDRPDEPDRRSKTSFFGSNESTFSAYRLRRVLFHFHWAFVWLSIEKIGINRSGSLELWFLSLCNSVIVNLLLLLLLFIILIAVEIWHKQFTFSIDVNECTEVPGFCENGFCTNTIGGSRCECTTGYKLNVAGDACVGEELDTRNLKLFWALL